MKKQILTTTLLLLSSAAFATTEVKVPQCSEVMAEKHWANLEIESKKLDALLASPKSTDADLVLEGYKAWSTAVIDSTKELDSYFVPKDGKTITELTQVYVEQHIISGKLKPDDYPTFLYTNQQFDAPATTKFTLYERDGVKQESRFTIETDSVKQCERVLQCQGRTPTKTTACDVLARSWEDTVNKYKATIKQRTAALVGKYAVATEASWAKFHNEARYQYPWEKMITAWWLSKELSGDTFVSPPSYQVHFIRPWAVLEYVNDADDGSQFKAAATVEWLGVNSWQTCSVMGVELFKVPCGMSAVSTFSDRAGSDDIGHGAMLHFDNQYSLGATWRSSGDVGFFLTVDLLKALEDKEESIKKWQAKADEYLN
ncbi:hypothetical protein C9J12_27115 [Photobacterium frigidiphilum]|uniref:FAS1 domain-containing protein n=1 Tax=Photobacterium frigidiphilum TaxID=264736 RepID=A0A2T3J6Z5_9GAMM|nr:hypothetical protein [Photobacterium frigidiphilum]PSU44488.1 hypothetical protein C9J12_27115 [Photobacterium frigidiphilum]